MDKKKLYGIIAVIIVIIGGFYAYNQHQEHQMVLAQQQEEKEFKEFCNNTILQNLNKCQTLHNDVMNTVKTSAGRHFENLFQELNMHKDKISTLKQDLAAISAKTDKQKEVRRHLKESINAVDEQATYFLVYYEKQRSAQGAEGWNQEEYDRYIAERDAALEKVREIDKRFVENRDKIVELAHFTKEQDNKTQSQEEK